MARHGSVETEGELPADLPTGEGVLSLLEVLLAHYRAPAATAFGPDVELPPLHSGVVGYLGYDVVREVERLPHVPTDDRGWPDAVLSVIGEVVAYDHWNQRVTLVANAFVEAGAPRADLDAAYDDALARLETMAADGARTITEPLVDPPVANDVPADLRSSISCRTSFRSSPSPTMMPDLVKIVWSISLTRCNSRSEWK